MLVWLEKVSSLLLLPLDDNDNNNNDDDINTKTSLLKNIEKCIVNDEYG
jgi:hypothetical protein